MTKLCPRYDDLEAILGNDSATGDHAVTCNDNFSHIHDENVNEVDGQNDFMDQSEVRAPSVTSKDEPTKFDVDVLNPMMRVSVPYRALSNRLKKLLMLWRFKLR